MVAQNLAGRSFAGQTLAETVVVEALQTDGRRQKTFEDYRKTIQS